MSTALDEVGRVVFRTTFAFSLSIMLLPACSEEDGPAASTLEGFGLNGGGTGTSSDANTGGVTAGTNGGTTTTTGGSTGTDAGSTTAGAKQFGEGMPCEVRQVISERCTLCHDDPASFGAPMPLVSQPHFAAAAPGTPGASVAEAVDQRINSTDPNLVMPPSTQTPLSAEEKATLQAWLDQGAPYVSEGCETAGGTGGTGTTTTGGGGGGTGTGGETTGATGGVPEDANLTCYKLKAHADGDAATKFGVGAAQDRYVNFNFMPPWGDKTVYARTIRSIIDNKQVLHHWLFFRNGGPKQDLSVEESSGTHPDSELVYGWAPGGKDLNFYEDGDVGMELPGDVSYTLELHYNSSDPSALDASGLELCVSEEPPEAKAGQAWLGTDAISSFGLLVNDLKASGTCNPASEEPIHIIGVSPHMHLKGVHMTSIINRADGSKETLHDGAFDFNDQTSYQKDVWIMPGDTITTTCEYSEPANFGEGTGDEMCYLFTMHTPAGALSDNGPAGTAIHGSGACLGL